MRWGDLNDRGISLSRVEERRGWLTSCGAPTEQEPGMAGAFTALRRMNDERPPEPLVLCPCRMERHGASQKCSCGSGAEERPAQHHGTCQP